MRDRAAREIVTGKNWKKEVLVIAAIFIAASIIGSLLGLSSTATIITAFVIGCVSFVIWPN